MQESSQLCDERVEGFFKTLPRAILHSVATGDGHLRTDQCGLFHRTVRNFDLKSWSRPRTSAHIFQVTHQVLSAMSFSNRQSKFVSATKKLFCQLDRLVCSHLITLISAGALWITLSLLPFDHRRILPDLPTQPQNVCVFVTYGRFVD